MSTSLKESHESANAFLNSDLPNSNDLQQHVGSVHEGKKSFKCETCDITSSVKGGDLHRHITSNHEVHERKKPQTCEFCDYSCLRGGDLKQHVTSAHERSRSNVNLVTIAVFLKTTCNNILR